MNYSFKSLVSSLSLSLLFVLFSGLSYAQTKQLDVAGQVDNLMVSLDDLSFTQKKIQIIQDRIEGIPQEDVEQSGIPDMLISLNNEKERRERIIASTEHYLNSIGAEVEISAEKYESYTPEVQDHISSNELYKIIQ